MVACGQVQAAGAGTCRQQRVRGVGSNHIVWDVERLLLAPAAVELCDRVALVSDRV